ncbi:MAG: hypothetical protein H6631_16500 [Anaerolineaceae bacterium]|nr:hypothetical protein [Anaerolineaceae bacterium]
MTTDRTEPEQVKESVTNVIFVSGESSPTLMQSPPNWQQIIWREWRNCNDAAYAEHLFRLSAGEPIDRRAILMIAADSTFRYRGVLAIASIFWASSGGDKTRSGVGHQRAGGRQQRLLIRRVLQSNGSPGLTG